MFLLIREKIGVGNISIVNLLGAEEVDDCDETSCRMSVVNYDNLNMLYILWDVGFSFYETLWVWLLITGKLCEYEKMHRLALTTYMMRFPGMDTKHA